jgi:hypothetical protein
MENEQNEMKKYNEWEKSRPFYFFNGFAFEIVDQ